MNCKKETFREQRDIYLSMTATHNYYTPITNDNTCDFHFFYQNIIERF